MLIQGVPEFFEQNLTKCSVQKSCSVEIKEVRNEELNVRMFISMNTEVELSCRVIIVAQMSAPQL